MAKLRVFLLGEFKVLSGEQDLTSQCPHKLQELLCYLLIYRDRTHPREALAGQLWSDSSTSQSKKNLRQALWQLQNAMEPEGSCADHHLLLADADYIRVDPDADLWLDVAVLEEGYERARGASGHVLDAPRVAGLRQAVDLYRGDLLEGWFQDWCLYERERLQNMYLAMLDKLIDHCEAHHQYEDGLAFGVEILRYDQARERTHRRMMRLYYLAGNRTAALRQYEHCVQALRRELAVGPAARTVALYEQIRAEHVPIPMGRAATELIPTLLSDARPAELLDYLKQLQRALSEVQLQLQHAINAVDPDQGS
jgi:DNA-binding SARP family transcriptional activator